MNVTYNIETQRLLFREMRTSDVDDMFRLDSNPEVHKYLGKKPFTERNQSEDYVNDVISDYSAYGVSRWIAIEKASGQFIGWCGLRYYPKKYQFNGRFGFYDIGYRLLPEFWGNGYATEGSLASLNYGFNELNLKTIFGITEKDNEASHKVLLKIGLRHTEDFYEERLQEHLRWYELKKEEYETKMS